MDYTFWVYIVASRSGTLYVGMTNDIYLRVAQHKSGEFEGFASKYECTRLVYYEQFQNVLHAISREKQLKGWRREKKINLIKSLTRAGRTWRNIGASRWCSRTKA